MHYTLSLCLSLPKMLSMLLLHSLADLSLRLEIVRLIGDAGAKKEQTVKINSCQQSVRHTQRFFLLLR